MFYAQDTIENAGYLDIYNQTPAIIYSIPIEHISKNDIIITTTEFEATNNYQFNVSVGAKIILTNHCNKTADLNLDQPNGFNITPGMHHGTVAKFAIWRAPQDFDAVCINTIAWSASDASHPYNYLLIEQGYGHLDAIIIKES